jgi:hypothetical protein
VIRAGIGGHFAISPNVKKIVINELTELANELEALDPVTNDEAVEYLRARIAKIKVEDF